MSITKSYNKKTNTYYAYETTYEWSEQQQKKIQRRHCIGKFDPITGDIIPNGKVGRPSLYNLDDASFDESIASKEETPHMQSIDSNKLSEKLNRIAETLQILSSEIHDLSEELQFQPTESSGEC